jgi:hypothetical protein
MSDQNGLKGGVLLGGRQFTITLSREQDATLKVLAQINKTSAGVVLDYIVAKGIDMAWEEFMVSKLMWSLANWVTWARWGTAVEQSSSRDTESGGK